MKHDRSMLLRRQPAIQPESQFARYLHRILTYGAKLLRLARSPQDAKPRKENGMADLPEIPTDEDVLAALEMTPGGLTPTELMAVLEPDHTRDNIIRAIQRVLDRGKVHLSDGAKLVPATVHELADA